MLSTFTGPGQPFAVGLTVIPALAVKAPLLLAINAGIFPLPLDAKPIIGPVLVHVKVVPGIVPVKLMAVVVCPLHNT